MSAIDEFHAMVKRVTEFRGSDGGGIVTELQSLVLDKIPINTHTTPANLQQQLGGHVYTTKAVSALMSLGLLVCTDAPDRRQPTRRVTDTTCVTLNAKLLRNMGYELLAREVEQRRSVISVIYETDRATTEHRHAIFAAMKKQPRF